MEAIKRQIFVLRDTIKDCIDYTLGTDMVPIEYNVMDFTIPATATAVVYVLKQDGKLDKILADVIGNVISFRPEKGFFAEGINAIQIRIVDNNKALVSFTETVRAGKSMKFDDDAEAQQETLIEQVLTKVGEFSWDIKNEKAERIAGDENEKTERNKAIASERAERKTEIDIERQRINNLTKLQEGSTTGDAELADIRVGADGKKYENAGEAVRKQVSALKEELVTEKEYTNSMLHIEYWDFTKYGIIKEKCYVKSNVETDADGFFSIYMIPVKPNTRYQGNPNGGVDAADTYARFVNYYNKEKLFIGNGNDNQLPTIFTTPENCYYITVSIPYKSDGTKGVFWLTNKKDRTNDYIHFNKPISPETIFGISPWFNKKYISHGDSITWYDGQNYEDGSVCVGYQTIMNNRIKFYNVRNEGWSGHSMADGTANGDGCVTRILEINHSDYDLCTIACGTNDFKLNVPLGTLGTMKDTSFERTTFYGAYRTAIQFLLKQKPTLRIVLFTPLQRDNNGYDVEHTNNAGYKLRDYVNAIKKLGEMYGLPVCDMYANSGFTKLTLETYTIDGLHPNNKGFERMGNYATQFVNSIGC